jgi:hypothetical protein
VSIRQPNKEVFRLDRKDWVQVQRDARKRFSVKRLALPLIHAAYAKKILNRYLKMPQRQR